jgi:MYXO-CTERM domain-containing protein
MVQVDVLASDIDQDLDLYASTGAVQNSNLTQSTSPNGEESVRLIHNDGPLYFVVMPYEAARGDYELSVTCTEFLDEFEPNNSIEQAGFLDCNSNTAHFMEQGERDWFALPLDENEPYSFNIQADGDFDLDLYITTSASENDVVEQSTTPTGNEGVQSQALQYQLYAVVVPFREATGVYTLNFQCPNREITTPEKSTNEEEKLELQTTSVKTQSVNGCGCHAAPSSNRHGGALILLLFLSGRILRRRKQ